MINIYCDGACSGNPGPGGWAAIILSTTCDTVKGREDYTTNNRMELLAAIEGLKYMTNKSYKQITIHTDSIYVKNGVTIWSKNWLKNKWKNNKIKNQDLWQSLIEINNLLKPEWRWIKGHYGHYYNELADKLAKAAIKYSINKVEDCD
jgi:ribonuclease HI